MQIMLRSRHPLGHHADGYIPIFEALDIRHELRKLGVHLVEIQVELFAPDLAFELLLKELQIALHRVALSPQATAHRTTGDGRHGGLQKRKLVGQLTRRRRGGRA